MMVRRIFRQVAVRIVLVHHCVLSVQTDEPVVALELFVCRLDYLRAIDYPEPIENS